LLLRRIPTANSRLASAARFHLIRKRPKGSDTFKHVPFWILALAVSAALVGLLIGLERCQSWHREIGEDADGLFADQSRSQHAGVSISADAAKH
jgi:hypothetical protein